MPVTAILQINASIHNGAGQSSKLAGQFAAALAGREPGTEVIVRDVAAAEPVPHLTSERFGAFIARPEERT